MMGMLVNGHWTDNDEIIVNGHFVRKKSVFNDAIGSDVIRQIQSGGGQVALIASMSCPWSHRVLLVHSMRHLGDKLPLLIAGEPRIEGYGVRPDDAEKTLNIAGIDHLHQLYTIAMDDYTGRVTVPLLWDCAEQMIVSNESATIMRALDAVGDPSETLVPENLCDEIDALNVRIHDKLANGVYRAGLAQCQSAHDEAVADVFSMMEELEQRISNRRYLFGSSITETDLRLFATLVRFDSVYHTHFRCHRYRLTDFPNLWAYARDIYGLDGVAETVDFKANQRGYYLNDGDHNPHGIVPDLPIVDWSQPHNRDQL